MLLITIQASNYNCNYSNGHNYNNHIISMDVIIIIPFDRCATPQLNTLSLSTTESVNLRSPDSSYNLHTSLFCLCFANLQICNFSYILVLGSIDYIRLDLCVCVSAQIPHIKIS